MRICTTLLLFLICSCANKNNSTEDEVATYDTSTLYYDIPLGIKNEIAEVKRTFAYTYMLTIEGTARDSVEIDSAKFLQLASPFLQLDLNHQRIRKYYKESIFEDGDTKSIVLNYSTNNPELPVRSASIMLDNETQQFKRMDIQKSYAKADTSYEERLAWIRNKNFQIIQIASTKETETTRQIYVKWNQR